MLTVARKPEDCRYRQPAQADGAACELLSHWMIGREHQECVVTPEICNACCHTVEPAVHRPNSVVASVALGRLSPRLRSALPPVEVVRVSETINWLESYLPRAESVAVPELMNRTATKPGTGSWIDWFRRRGPRVGLIGCNNQKGLGHQNRDLARRLPLQSWLVPEAQLIVSEEDSCGGRATRYLQPSDSPQKLRDEWLSDLDVLLFVETPYIEGLTAVARQVGVRVVCVPNWEWLHPGLNWLSDVDTMLCPTRHTRMILEAWRSRFGFRWQIADFPWPVDVSNWSFRQRQTCERFVVINGTDRGHPARLDGTATSTRRKGLETLLAAARQLPHMPFILWSQTDELPDLPQNVELRLSSASNVDLYQEGDVCVQLSRWEGLGLPLLECQAAGMPLITSDAPPMNEHHPLAVVRTSKSEVLELWHRRLIEAPLFDVQSVVETLQEWFGRDIRQASRDARKFIEREHNWDRARNRLIEMLL